MGRIYLWQKLALVAYVLLLAIVLSVNDIGAYLSPTQLRLVFVAALTTIIVLLLLFMACNEVYEKKRSKR